MKSRDFLQWPHSPNHQCSKVQVYKLVKVEYLQKADFPIDDNADWARETDRKDENFIYRLYDYHSNEKSVNNDINFQFI